MSHPPNSCAFFALTTNVHSPRGTTASLPQSLPYSTDAQKHKMLIETVLDGLLGEGGDGDTSVEAVLSGLSAGGVREVAGSLQERIGAAQAAIAAAQQCPNRCGVDTEIVKQRWELCRTVTLQIDQNFQYRFPLDSSEAIGVRN